MKFLLYYTLLNLIDANINITPITVSNLLEVNSAFQEFGGPEYLANLTTIAIAVIDIRDYGRIVYDAAIKRQLIIVSQEAIQDASNASVLNDAKLQLEMLESKIYALINDGPNRGGFVNSRRLAADALAYKELGIPIIALSQLSRAVEQRADKRPILSHLRESGSIEQDADVVMLLYREEYYLRAREPEINTPEHSEWVGKLSKMYNVAEIIITKHRRGPMGNIKLHYDSKCSKFCSMHNNCSL